MEIENLKIYSGSIYSWNLSIREPLTSDYPASYRDVSIIELAKSSDFNQDYFISEKRIINQAFFVREYNHIKEVLTGIELPATSLKTSGDRELLERFYCNYWARFVHIRYDDLHEEIDVDRIKEYIKRNKKNIQIIEKTITSAQNDLNILTDFFCRQYEYSQQNNKKVMQLVKQIQDSWKN